MLSPALLQWNGPRPDPKLLKRLAARGLKTRTTAQGPVVARVIFTSRALEAPRPTHDALPWLWISARPVSQRLATEAVLEGAYDVISLDSPDAAERIVRRVREIQATPAAPQPTSAFVGKSPSSRRVLEQVARAARTSMPVLLTGETGTGKEVCARLIHEWSSRRERRFVPINCAAIPNELMEAELFGYARGAFSGAVQRYEGRLMAAEGGTVFLDEIDDTPLSLQVKLLRVVQDRVVSRLGENEWQEVDFRIIAASNRDLRRLIRAGAFGADLYERLAIVSIKLPPLRDRLADLPSSSRTSSRSSIVRSPMVAGASASGASTARPSRRFRRIPGRATCGSSETCSSKRWSTNVPEKSFFYPIFLGASSDGDRNPGSRPSSIAPACAGVWRPAR